MKINKSIFKAYDIRGIYPDELDEETTKVIVNSLVQYLQPKTILISKDTRKSGVKLFNTITQVIPSYIKTFYVELSTTPMLYFLAGKLDVDLSIMITASHNPPQYNGFKISKKNVYPISGEEILELIEKTHEQLNQQGNRFNSSCVIEEIKGAVSQYRKFLLEQVNRRNFKRVLHLAIDCANGVSGLVLSKLFKGLPVEAALLCMVPDGNFPNHNPNPLIFENIKHLSDFIKEGNFDLGVAFDGDADRVIFLDEKGVPISSDLMAIYISHALKRKKNIDKVFIDTRSTQSVIEELNKINIKVERIKAGHLFMRRKLAENQNCFAAELSGHYYYKENYNSDAAILTMLLVLETLSQENTKISHIVKEYKKYETTGELNYEVTDKDNVLHKIDKYFVSSKKEFIDGLSIYEDDFYLNVRKSNTENFVRIVIEAKTKDILNKMKEKIEENIFY